MPSLSGDYCWSVEHLLNRVVNATVPRTPELVSYLRRAIPVVAELFEQLEVGTAPASDIRALIAEADELGRAVTPVQADTGSDSVDVTEVLPLPGLDGVLASPPEELPVMLAELPSWSARRRTTDETLVAHLPPFRAARLLVPGAG